MQKVGKRKNRKLTSRSIVLVLVLNVVVIAGTYLFFGWFLGVQAGDEGRAVPGGFGYRELWLCLLFSSIVNGVLDYKMIVRPVWDLEDVIHQYKTNAESREWGELSGTEEDESIETVLNQLLRRQIFIHEKSKMDEKQRQKAELYALQTQINPHFLYNALDSIRGYALLHDMEEISDITEALSRVFRNMISDKNELLPLRRELDNIRNYMKIQQFRFNNKFAYSFDVEEDLMDKYMIPRMIFQPLVENAIMHGLERKIEGGWIRISVCITERRFLLTVTDNGAGISEERLEMLNQAMKMNPSEYKVSGDMSHTGIALVNINQRIKLNFGSQYGIILNSTPNVRTSTEVVLPLLLNRK